MNWTLIALIAGIALAVVALEMIRRAVSCTAGWRAWICYSVAMLHRVVFSHCRHVNECTIPEDGAAIVVANHTSPVDPVLLWMDHFRRFRVPRLRVIGYMMAKEYYTRGGLIGWVCHAMESIPVERAGRDMIPIRDALRRLMDGKLLGLFPEGRLNVKSPDEHLLPGGTGVAWLALKSGAPVIPVFIRNAPRARSMAWAFLVRSRTTLTFGPPVDLSPWKDSSLSHHDLCDVTDLIMKTIAELGGIGYTPVARPAGERTQSQKSSGAD